MLIFPVERRIFFGQIMQPTPVSMWDKNLIVHYETLIALIPLVVVPHQPVFLCRRLIYRQYK